MCHFLDEEAEPLDACVAMPEGRIPENETTSPFGVMFEQCSLIAVCTVFFVWSHPTRWLIACMARGKIVVSLFSHSYSHVIENLG